MRNSPLAKIYVALICLQVGAIPLNAATKNHSENHAARTSHVTNLQEVVRVVLARNPDILAARANWQAMRERVPQARAWKDPQVAYTQLFQRTPAKPPNSKVNEALTVEQTLPISGKNQSRARMADAEAAQAFATLRRTKWDAVTKAKIAWLRLANSEAEIALNRENSESLSGLAESTRAQYANGKRFLSDVLTAKIALQKNDEALADLKLVVVAQESQLNALMNRKPDASMTASSGNRLRTVSISQQQARTLALGHRPELEFDSGAIANGEARLQLAHREWIPDLKVQLTAGRFNDTRNAANEISGGVAVNIPWVNAGKYKAETREAEARLKGARTSREGELGLTFALIRSQFARIKTYRHHYALYRANVIPLSEQSVKSQIAHFANGEMSLTDVLAEQQALYNEQSIALQYLLEHEIAISELESLLGCNLPNSKIHEK